MRSTVSVHVFHHTYVKQFTPKQTNTTPNFHILQLQEQKFILTDERSGWIRPKLRSGTVGHG